jgi:hypothetical protein
MFNCSERRETGAGGGAENRKNETKPIRVGDGEGKSKPALQLVAKWGMMA